MASLFRSVPAPALVEDVSSYFEANLTGYRSVEVRGVIAKINTSWRCVSWMAHGVVEHEPLVDDATLDYGDVRLCRKRLKPAEFPPFLVDVRRTRRLFDVETGGTEQNSSGADRFVLHARNGYSDHCGVCWLMREDTNVVLPGGPLLAPNLPYYRDAYEALRHWLGLREWHVSRDGRIGAGIVFLPERRARFVSLSLGDPHGLVVEVEKSPWFKADVHVNGASRLGDAAVAVSVPVRDGPVELALLEDAEALELFLIDDHGVVLDFHREGPARQEGLGRVLTPSVNAAGDDLRSILDRGENDYVEFKEFVAPRENPRWRQLLESIAAFANSRGGTVFIGVAEGSVVEGIEKQLPTWSKGRHPKEAVCDAYAREVRHEISGGISPSPEVRSRLVQIAGHDVILLEVAPSTTTVHELLDSHDVYVRRGSTDRKATPEEHRVLLSKHPHLPWQAPGV